MIRISTFKFPHYLFDLQKLDVYPTLTHVYGKEPPVSDKTHWMSYQAPRLAGEISFLKNMYLHHLEFTTHVAYFLSELIGEECVPARVNFMKTKGSILKHVDEAGRKCAINIGVRNSNHATTHYFVDGNNQSAICQDEGVYLLNTASPHAVEANSTEERLLLTYGFGVSYKTLAEKFR